MTFSVYVAASSLDIDRAERWITALKDAGIAVTSTWPAVVRDVGSANPRHASHSQRQRWSLDDVDQVDASTLLWFLVPPLDLPTRGAWIELGWALKAGQLCVASGDTKQSIFCSLARECDTDEEAFEWICKVRDEEMRLRAFTIGGGV